MTVANKISSLIVAITLVAGLLVSMYTAQREYRAARDNLLRTTAFAVANTPRLQLAVYNRNLATLRSEADEIKALSPAIGYIGIHDIAGKSLLQKDPSGIAQGLSLLKLRRGVSPLDPSLTSLPSEIVLDNRVTLALLLGGEVVIHQTLPVYSLIKPTEGGISVEEFGRELARSSLEGSRHAIGYVHLGISRTALWAQILPSLLLVGAISLAFVIICLVIAHRITRSITRPLERLAQLANDIGSGSVNSNLDLHGSNEISEIASLLNSIMGGLKNYKSKIDVDHHLLSLKVEERTRQLSRRNEELNEAVREVTRTKNRLREMAYFDSLTALPNRRLFTEQLNLLIRLARRHDQTLALMFLDLDNFKRINDSLGHAAGDLLLKQVAHRLSDCVRESDVVAHYVDSETRIDVSRLGGDEFTVVLNQLEQPESAGLVARRLIESLVQPMTIDGHELVITPSIGIAIFPRDADNVEDLLRAADTAMYHAKQGGKNNYLYYGSEMEASGLDRLQLETDLRRAIEREEMRLYYQPQVDTVTGNVIGVEALMRWQHGEMGLVPPFKFIPLAEELGLIGELGSWALEEACNNVIALRKQGLKLPRVSVNVSPVQFNEAFVNRVAEVLQEAGLEPNALQLELTESIAMDDATTTIALMDSLKEIGVRLSIDDFGTGYSSLSYLSRFPLDELKIDRSFVIDLDKSENNAKLAAAIIAMARSLNLELVAEGVESVDQYRFLTHEGAKIIQGYLFSPPVELEDLKPMLDPFHFAQQIQAIPRE